VAEIETNAFKEYVKEVKNGEFPTDDYCYHIKKGAEDEFYEMLKEFE
jgi:3-methyl-2-oxobutanoate hydroxymethyltransferase